MKIYVCHLRNFDYQKELYEPLRDSDLNQAHELIFPHESGPEVKTKDIIASCDVVLAEVSYPATGLGIEIGWADASNKKIICMLKEGAKISGSLKYVCNQFIEYSDTNDLISKISETL